jgi:hypothetical protein
MKQEKKIKEKENGGRKQHNPTKKKRKKEQKNSDYRAGLSVRKAWALPPISRIARQIGSPLHLVQVLY